MIGETVVLFAAAGAIASATNLVRILWEKYRSRLVEPYKRKLVRRAVTVKKVVIEESAVPEGLPRESPSGRGGELSEEKTGSDNAPSVDRGG